MSRLLRRRRRYCPCAPECAFHRDQQAGILGRALSSSILRSSSQIAQLTLGKPTVTSTRSPCHGNTRRVSCDLVGTSLGNRLQEEARPGPPKVDNLFFRSLWPAGEGALAHQVCNAQGQVPCLAWENVAMKRAAGVLLLWPQCGQWSGAIWSHICMNWLKRMAECPTNRYPSGSSSISCAKKA